MGLASCNPCSSSLLARPRNPSSGYLYSIRVFGVRCGKLLRDVCGEEVRHLPLANISVLGYREMQPMARSRVYLPFRQPLADSRSWSACRPTFRANIPNPSLSDRYDLHDCPKAGYGTTEVMCSQADIPHESRPSEYMATSLQSLSYI